MKIKAKRRFIHPDEALDFATSVSGWIDRHVFTDRRVFKDVTVVYEVRYVYWK